MVTNQHKLFDDAIVSPDQLVLVTGAAGFIGRYVVERLLRYGFRNVRCMVRPSGDRCELQRILSQADRRRSRYEIFEGNLLAPEQCRAAAANANIILHLAAGRGQKSFADAVLNSAVTTRNLLEAATAVAALKRFVNVSSFSIYSNRDHGSGAVLDETSSVDPEPEKREDPYCFAKVLQEEVVWKYVSERQLPAVVVRPGVVYGPGNESITGRVGIGTFGLFLHLGASSSIPLTYVENCADAIVRAGVIRGIDGEVFNVVDDDLPVGAEFLSAYKRKVRRFRSARVAPALSYALCYIWERYATKSQRQLPPVFNRRTWHAYWKPTRYTNLKLKSRLGWKQVVRTPEALDMFFASCRRRLGDA